MVILLTCIQCHHFLSQFLRLSSIFCSSFFSHFPFSLHLHLDCIRHLYPRSVKGLFEDQILNGTMSLFIRGLSIREKISSATITTSYILTAKTGTKNLWPLDGTKLDSWFQCSCRETWVHILEGTTGFLCGILAIISQHLIFN